MAEDWTDRHVARWKDHWLDLAFDEAVEGVFVRVNRIDRYLRRAKQRAVAEVGLLLRQSAYAGQASYESAVTRARTYRQDDGEGYRAEFINLVKKAKALGK